MGRYGWPGTVICIAPFPSTYLASTFLTSRQPRNLPQPPPPIMPSLPHLEQPRLRSEEHTSELQSLMRTSYAVSCLKKKEPKGHRTSCSTGEEQSKSKNLSH